ncbi:hypothetical protein BZG36_04401 [Bifiguratus adelaidae]|uniref:Mid2 domain-containing protein n=1 Tax=Bifiguratus adelaidae TaxID=1938954 RepID=A0A261XVR3_9FUNG|nr:hypothetical protein BZG36_04401 [Bifiguratus adelaidae]
MYRRPRPALPLQKYPGSLEIPAANLRGARIPVQSPLPVRLPLPVMPDSSRVPTRTVAKSFTSFPHADTTSSSSSTDTWWTPSPTYTPTDTSTSTNTNTWTDTTTSTTMPWWTPSPSVATDSNGNPITPTSTDTASTDSGSSTDTSSDTSVWIDPATLPPITPPLITPFSNSSSVAPTDLSQIAASSQQASSGPNKDAIIGGTVGGVAAVALVGALGLFAFKRRRAKENELEAFHPEMDDEEYAGGVGGYASPSHPVYPSENPGMTQIGHPASNAVGPSGGYGGDGYRSWGNEAPKY